MDFQKDIPCFVKATNYSSGLILTVSSSSVVFFPITIDFWSVMVFVLLSSYRVKTPETILGAKIGVFNANSKTFNLQYNDKNHQVASLVVQVHVQQIQDGNWLPSFKSR